MICKKKLTFVLGILFLFSITFISAGNQFQIPCILGDNQLSIGCLSSDSQFGLPFSHDSVAPIITIFYPVNGNIYGTNVSFPLNFSVADSTGVSSCRYNIVYENVFQAISNTTLNCNLNTTFNLPLSGLYILNMYANDTFNNLRWNQTNFTLSLTYPAVNLNIPTNNSWKTTTNVTFNFTATDSDGIDSCRFYTNSSSSWINNKTITSVTSGIEKSFYQDINQGNHIWNVECNDTAGFSKFATNNYTVKIDSIIPNVSISTFNNTVISGLTMSLVYNISDINTDSCYFTLLSSSTGLPHNFAENTTLSCSTGTIDLSTTSAGAYSIRIWAEDYANNINTSIINFSTSISTSISGGGGSTPQTTVGDNKTGWSIVTETNSESYELLMIQGSSRSKTIALENLGNIAQDIYLTCSDVNSSLPGVCQYVTFEKSIISLPVQKQVKVVTLFTINLPRDAQEGDYVFNINGIDKFGRKAFITVKLTTDLGFVSTIFAKIVFSPMPYLFIYLFLILFLSFISYHGGFKRIKLKKGTATSLSVIFGLVSGLIIIGLPLPI